MDPKKKKLLKQTGIRGAIILVFAIGFTVAMLNLKTNCDKFETECNITVYDKFWCTIQYDVSDHYTYQCPHYGSKCKSGNTTTVKCYNKYDCPETTCQNPWATVSATLLGMLGGVILLWSILDFIFKWGDYREDKRIHNNHANNNHVPRDTIIVSSYSA